MKNKEMEIVVKPDGTVDIDMIGYQGKGCSEEIIKLLDAVGGKSKKKQKSEFYQKEKVQVQQKRS